MSTEQRIESRRAADTYSDTSANAVSRGGQHRGNRGGTQGGGAPPAPRPPQQPAPRGPPTPQPPVPPATQRWRWPQWSSTPHVPTLWCAWPHRLTVLQALQP
jgi:hypothetical protein